MTLRHNDTTGYATSRNSCILAPGQSGLLWIHGKLSEAYYGSIQTSAIRTSMNLASDLCNVLRYMYCPFPVLNPSILLATTAVVWHCSVFHTHVFQESG